MTDSYTPGSIHYYMPRYGSRDDNTGIRHSVELDDSPAEQETQTEEESREELFRSETVSLQQNTSDRYAAYSDTISIQPMTDGVTTATETTAAAGDVLTSRISSGTFNDWNANFWSSPISFTFPHPTGDPITPKLKSKPKPIINPKQVTRRILNFSEEGWVVQ